MENHQNHKREEEVDSTRDTRQMIPWKIQANESNGIRCKKREEAVNSSLEQEEELRIQFFPISYDSSSFGFESRAM